MLPLQRALFIDITRSISATPARIAVVNHAEFGTKQDRMHFRQLQQCKQLSSRNQLLIHRHETEKTRAFKEYALISITRLVLMLCCRVHTRYENQLQLLDETHNISQHHVEQTFVANPANRALNQLLTLIMKDRSMMQQSSFGFHCSAYQTLVL